MNHSPHLGGRAAVAAAFIVALPLLLSPVQAFAADSVADPKLCTACHMPEGNPAIPAIPSIAGQPAQFLSIELYQFREGNRKDAQMTPMAANLSNADMNELAAYFSGQKPAASSHRSTPENIEAGKRLTERFNCVQCHGPKLLGQQHIPRLAGQSYEYLLKQLRGFKASTAADLDGNMTSAAQALSAADIEILVDYLSGLNPF